MRKSKIWLRPIRAAHGKSSGRVPGFSPGLHCILTAMAFAVLAATSCKREVREINLAGEWEVALDSLDEGIAGKWYMKTFADGIVLPGTLCDAGYGMPCTLKPSMDKEVFLNLKRKFDYLGPAWYAKECRIPKEWKGKDIFLTLERVIWNSQVWVNGIKVKGFGESLVAPHRFDLTRYIEPGEVNRLTIRIDNRKQHDVSYNDLAHAYTNDTQTMWNGILGNIMLTARDKVRIEELRLTPDVDGRSVGVRVKVAGGLPSRPGKLLFSVREPGGKKLAVEEVEISGEETAFAYPIPDAKLWDEFNPNVYEATATIKADGMTDTVRETFGMRKLEVRDTLLQINGRRLFLRGTLECCVFPLRGYPPTDEESWEKVFRTARDYGLNHLRFHSWCPPEAAFDAADRTGFYLQVELPVWALNVGEDEGAVGFLREEADRIMKEYGNHPSFCLWSLGNELEGDFGILNGMLSALKRRDDRHLYTTTTFTFARGHTGFPEPGDDFWVTQWTGDGWVRGQGIFDEQPPCFDEDYSDALKNLTVPLVAHEVGQYSVFPDLKEIGKYTGNLIPLNFKAVYADLRRKGRLPLAEDYLAASGHLAAILYKEEIERALKTPGFSGFQLLGLQDFPGQGTALVGIVDAFRENKGLTSPEEFRRFCSPVVPLARFGKATYTNDETFTARAEVANFGDKPLKGIQGEWTLRDSKGTLVAEGSLDRRDVPVGNGFRLGDIAIPLSSVAVADKLTFSVGLGGTEYRNSWNIWVYPHELPAAGGGIFYTRSFAEAEKALGEGKKVLLNPEKGETNGLEGKFVQVFWSPVHFPDQPGTMGVLCDPSHPALADFPTEGHSDWQWWDICKNATTMELDSLGNGLRPIVAMVDNFYKNRNLGLLFEAKSGGGKLLVCSTDLSRDLDVRPAARQLRYSLLRYMESDGFDPQAEIAFGRIRRVLQHVRRTGTKE